MNTNGTVIQERGITYERFCVPVTFRCNLKCKLCAEYVPYTAKPYHPTFDSLTSQLRQLFSMVFRIGKFDLTGGEPFIRRDLAAVLSHLRLHYNDRIDIVRVTTNGTILPSAAFISEAVRWGEKIYVIIDNYPVSDKSNQIFAQLQDAAVPCELRDYSADLHCDGWVDYGDISLKHSQEEAQRIFKKCMVPKLGFFSCMVNGVVFPCARARLLYENSIDTVAVDLFDTKLTKREKKEQLLALLGCEAVHACRYCNGLCEDSPRFNPAEQLNS